jgi:Zn-dependent protease with chaperone function
MTYGVLAVSAGLAWFLIVSVAASAAVAAAYFATAARATGRPVRAGASVWLGLRLLPLVVSLLFVLLIFGSAFVRFEPGEAVEAPGFGLVVMAATSAILIGRAACRAIAGWHRAASQARRWMKNSDDLPCGERSISIRAVRGARPVVSLVGLWRPRLFVSRTIAEALTPDELEAIVLHEVWHRSAWDNLKRLAVLAAPDALHVFGAGTALESRWMSAAELEADRGAARGDSERGLSLASALVKVARLMPDVRPLPAPVSNLYNGGPLAERVGRLVNSCGESPDHPALPWLGLAVTLLAGCAPAFLPVLPTVHRATEFLVNLVR